MIRCACPAQCVCKTPDGTPLHYKILSCTNMQMFQTSDYSVTFYSDWLNRLSLLLHCQQLVLMILYRVPWSLLLWLHGKLILPCVNILHYSFAEWPRSRREETLAQCRSGWHKTPPRPSSLCVKLMMSRWPSPTSKSLHFNTWKCFDIH